MVVHFKKSVKNFRKLQYALFNKIFCMYEKELIIYLKNFVVYWKIVHVYKLQFKIRKK